MKTIFTALAIFAVFNIHAQTTTNATQALTLNLQNQIDISITSATGTSFTFNSPTAYASGITNANAAQFQVRSNKGWTVTVNAATANFSGPASNSLPASALGVRVAGGNTFTNLSTTAASLTNGNKGTSSFAIDYNANPGFSYDAGTYSLNVVYTATQQ